ncbi:MAG TPA: S53 family peptidase, partial [Acidobacteriota bacterium]
MTKTFVTLHNSKRQQPAGVRSKDDVRPDEIIHVTVVVRAISSAEERKKAIADLSLQLPGKRKHLNRKDFIRLHGARDEDLQLVKKFAEDSKLRVIDSSKERRCVILSGTAQELSDAFQVDNRTYTHDGEVYRSYPDAIQIPANLKGVIEAVLGLENRSLMSHHAFMTLPHAFLAAGQSAMRHTEVREVEDAYKFPKADGKGQCIAIIELGGGFYERDIKKYFRTHKLRQPKISVVEIEGAKNNPAEQKYIEQVLNLMGEKTGNQKTGARASLPAELAHAMWTIESTLDVQLAGSFANAAEIVVYFAPNNAHGKYQAFTAALSNKKFSPSVISCSWGAVEETLPADVVSSLNHVFQDAALRGVTVCFSSGDKGEDPSSEGNPRVHFPASSPYVLSCGGTHWLKKERSIYEEVWSEALPKYVVQSGGGVSKIFERPDWQSEIKLQTKKSGRGVPDVSGKADIAGGYCMQVAGFDVTMGGTSAAAPMWAGLIARLNQELNCNIGYANPFLYQESCRSSFNDITKGNNGKHFKATPGWDPCT